MDLARGLLPHDDTIGWLEVELRRSAELADRCPPGMEIPTCPGWEARSLWQHLGAVHRWCTALVEQRASEPISRRSIELGTPDDDNWAAWISAGADRLVEALRGTPGDEPVWTWGTDHHARWWARRQLHETMVHNADAVLALGGTPEVDALVAADAICELLDNAPVRLTWPGATPPSVDATVHLHATDSHPASGATLLGDRGEWMVVMRDGAVSYTHGHAKGDTAVRGPVDHLMLVMNRRLDAGSADLESFGDPDGLAALVAAVAI